MLIEGFLLLLFITFPTYSKTRDFWTIITCTLSLVFFLFFNLFGLYLFFLVIYFFYRYFISAFFVQPTYEVSPYFMNWVILSFGPTINRRYWRGDSRWKAFGLEVISEQLTLCKVNGICLDVRLLIDWVFKLQLTRFPNVVNAFPYTYKNILRVITSNYNNAYIELKDFPTKGVIVFTNNKFVLLTEKGLVDNFFIKVPEGLATHKVLMNDSFSEGKTNSFTNDLKVILEALIGFIVSIKSAYSSFKVGKYWVTVKEIVEKDLPSNSSSSSKNHLHAEQNINIDINIDKKDE